MIDVLIALLLAMVPGNFPDDPIRYCYTIAERPMPPPNTGTINQPWSCYLEADRPAGYTPVWIGRESQVNEKWEPFRDIDGHTGCRILVGDTSAVECADGWRTQS